MSSRSTKLRSLIDGPKSWSPLKRLVVFVLFVFVLYMQAGLYASRRWTPAESPISFNTQSITSSQTHASGTHKPIRHPIPGLMTRAEDKYRNLLARQSKSLSAAVREYKRRYSRDPPKGFDDWWKFAVEHDVKMIDEYDAVVEDLAPFWQLSGDELRRRTLQVGQLPSIDLVRIQNGNTTVVNMQKDFVDSEVSARARGFRAMLRKFQEKLPDMDFSINAKAEGRILVPWEHRKYPNMTEQRSSLGIEVMLGGEFTADWRGDSNVWESFRHVCPPDSEARRLYQSFRLTTQSSRPINHFDSSRLVTGPGDDFSFPESVDNRFDFCHNPWAHYQQGHFFSDWRTISVLYPVFSPGKAPGYSDIRIPSHYYYSPSPRYTYGYDLINQKVQDIDNMEQPWQNKTDLVFWRGATTGGGSSPAGYAPLYQRHRFIRMASDKSEVNKTVIFADPQSSTYQQAKVSVKELNEHVMDAAFVKSTGYANYPGGRAAMLQAHRFADSVPLGEHWKYKYLIDLDGMGYSARFLAFLASDSAVIKSTVYLEYFSDWIQPWLHYIPLSQSYREIYNIHAFFSGPTKSMLEAVNSTAQYDISARQTFDDGDRRLRRIARAGRQWKQTVGREVDMEAYVYRLCLEWARLWSDDRELMNFTL